MAFELTTFLDRRRWLETHAVPLRDAGGSITGLMAITRDIDGRKRDEERLQRQQVELAHVCRLSTLGEPASGVGHELNQPLCAMSSDAEMALSAQRSADTNENVSIEQSLEKIVHETPRANGIIDRLRAFVLKRTPHTKPNDIRLLIQDILDLTETERRRTHVQIGTSGPDVLPEVCVDRVQTEQILLTLVNNAIQAVGGLALSRSMAESLGGDRAGGL